MRYVPLGVLSLLLPLTISAYAEKQSVQLDTPRSGWSESVGAGADFSQKVDYPAASVNMAARQNPKAQVKGRILGLPKPSTQPGNLVVNGVSMPLRVEEDGSFARPFIFPQGSNSVEVRSPDGQQRYRQQFYLTRGIGATPARLRIVMSWDTDMTDLDLHVVTPDGEHAWYGNRQLKNGGALDMDVTTGYGPEIFATPTPLKGRYLLYVNYYGGRGQQALTTAKFTIVTEEGTPDEKQETFMFPMRNPGELTLVKSFDY